MGELTDRYVGATLRSIPEKQRADISDLIWDVAECIVQLSRLDRLEPVGSAVPAVPELRVEGGRAVQMVVAPDGTLVYVSGSPRGAAQKQLLWVTRSQQQETLRTPARDFIGLRLSPDGRRAADGRRGRAPA